MRLQQQQQQRQHINQMLENTQRLQQQQQQQQQQIQSHQQQQQQQIPQQMTQQSMQNQMLSHPTPGSITAPSPQQHAAVSSPMVGRSPNPNRPPPTAAPMNIPGIQGIQANNIKMLVDNFPKLLELKRTGRLQPEQEKLVGFMYLEMSESIV